MMRLVKDKKKDKTLEKNRNRYTWNDPEHVGKFVQLAIYTVIILTMLGSVAYFMNMIRIDVNYRLEQRNLQHAHDYKECKRHYVENECAPELRVPALESLCQEWLTCIQEASIDIQSINNSAKLWAQTLAEVINIFLNEITLRSLLFILLILSASISLTRYTFGSYQVYYYNNKDLD